MLTLKRDIARYLDELAEFIAIPSVSRDATADTMHAAAQWLAGQLKCVNGRVMETEGHPIVQGEWLGASDAPTILVYGHYDVQPAGDLTEWHMPPFELHVDGDIMLGRGVADDKGPIYITLKTTQHFMAQEGRLPLNVKFLFEGEEEIGSPHLARFLAAHSDELMADLVVSADGGMWREDSPSLALTCKGLVAMNIHVTGANSDLHSGRYGGTVANPIHALCQIVASFHDEDGRVVVNGFYDGVPELNAKRRREIASIDFDEEKYIRDLGLNEVFGEVGFTTLERLWERPTLDVNGINGGGNNTIIPHLAVGYLSCRLVAGQNPEKVIQAIAEHVSSLTMPGVHVSVHANEGGVPAYTISAGHPGIKAATAALQQVYPDKHVLFAGMASTIPAATIFERALGIKTLFFSFSTADDKPHAPNEFMRIKRLSEGMRSWEYLWRFLASGAYSLTAAKKDSRGLVT